MQELHSVSSSGWWVRASGVYPRPQTHRDGQLLNVVKKGVVQMRKASLSGLVIVLCLMCGWPSMAQDQSSSRGNLGGVVYDSSKSVVPGAEVTITGPIGTQTQITNDQGSFLFSTLIPGSYSVKVHKAAFKVASYQSTEVLVNKTTSIEAVLET